MLRVTKTLAFRAHLVCPMVRVTYLRVLLVDPRVGVNFFLLFMVAERLWLRSILPSVRKILVLQCRDLWKAGVFPGTTTNLRKLTGELERVFLPTTPTTGMGKIPVPGLFRHPKRGRPSRTVVVPVMVREMFRTVPVFRWDPPGALLRLTTTPLTVGRRAVLRFDTLGVTTPPTPLMVPSMFPFLQCPVLLLWSL